MSALLLAAGLVAACGGSDSQASSEVAQALPPEERQLYEAAQNEPPMTWYTAQIPELDEATIAAFQERYPGLEVEFLRLASGELTTRYSQERTAGSNPAGLVTVADEGFFEEGMAQGWFEPEPELPQLESWPAEFYEGGVARVGILPYYLSHNTQRLPAEAAPQTWEDLLDPALAGQIHYGDPRSVPSYLGLALILRETYGDDFLRRFGAQNPTLVPSIVPGNQTLAAGGASVLVPNVRSIADPLIAEGAPIAVTEVSPTTGSEYLTAVATGTPSPSTAQLLMNYLLTEEGQAFFNGNGGSSPLGPVGETIPLPEGYVSPPIAEANQVRDELLGLLGIPG